MDKNDIAANAPAKGNVFARAFIDALEKDMTDTGRDVHAIMAHMESELLNLPDYATARFKALLAELKAKL